MAIRTAKPAKPRTKPQRFVRVEHREGTGLLLALTIKTPRTLTCALYIVTPLASDFGTAYEVEKEDGTTYHVNLDGQQHTCSCRGHTSHGHCKHAEALQALIAAGKIEARPIRRKPAPVVIPLGIGSPYCGPAEPRQCAGGWYTGD
jgi:hypothetical protein